MNKLTIGVKNSGGMPKTVTSKLRYRVLNTEYDQDDYVELILILLDRIDWMRKQKDTQGFDKK